MESSISYLVEITPEAEQYFEDLLSFLYQTHSLLSADKKSLEILTMAQSLSQNPTRGRVEDALTYLKKGHRYLIYSLSNRKTIKILYFVNEVNNTVFITDFFPNEMNPVKILGRDK